MDTEFLDYISSSKFDTFLYIDHYKFVPSKKRKWNIYDSISMKIPPKLTDVTSEQLINFIQNIKD